MLIKNKIKEGDLVVMDNKVYSTLFVIDSQDSIYKQVDKLNSKGEPVFKKGVKVRVNGPFLGYRKPDIQAATIHCGKVLKRATRFMDSSEYLIKA